MDNTHQTIEEEIEKAQRTVATRLSLAGRGLTELPESLGQLTQLEELNLSKNQLKVLPDWLVNLKQLKILDLNENQLELLPEWINHFKQLKVLCLSQNNLIKLPETLGSLKKIGSLSVRKNKLIELPPSMGQLTQLLMLDLSGNSLTGLPEWLGELKKLIYLFVWGNKLIGLPQSLEQLKQLEVLSLSLNHLVELPNCLGQLTQLKELDFAINKLTALPDWLSKLKQLQNLNLGGNHLMSLPAWLSQFTQLQSLGLGRLRLKVLPVWLVQLKQLQTLDLSYSQLTELPHWLGQLTQLNQLNLANNQLTALPESLLNLERLSDLNLDNNPLNPELAAAAEEGLEAIKRYLRAQAEAQVTLHEAKLILVGEGEVGKSCLLAALRGDPWDGNRPTTHGIEIKPLAVVDQATGQEITMNCWDFGGQRVYRPTHQLFFSSPAVYLVVWKPREGTQQGLVKEWIRLVIQRAPEAKILVVSTHGGPKARQPDIDRQEIWQLFGQTTVIDFLSIDSQPSPESGQPHGMDALRHAIAAVAAALPEMGRPFPRAWQEARHQLRQRPEAYLSFAEVKALCAAHQMGEPDARLLLRISHRLGDLIHYQHDPALGDVVVIKPDWLATAISYVLDDAQTREAKGLVSMSRLGQVWNDPDRPEETRYAPPLHPLFLRLMERYDLSYQVADPCKEEERLSLIGQLVPDVRPDVRTAWPETPSPGDHQQTQICRIVNKTDGQSATAEGLFYQLIVRLHKFSLGRDDYRSSLHWQRGLLLDDAYNGRALLEYTGNDVRLSVRAPYPQMFLAVLTREVKWLVESFWEGLRCSVMVPCIAPCGGKGPGTGLYEVEKLIDSKSKGRPDFPCPTCNEWQPIDALLLNAPAAQPSPDLDLSSNFAAIREELSAACRQLQSHQRQTMGRFDSLDQALERMPQRLDSAVKKRFSQVDAAYNQLMAMLLDEGKEGPRLFSLEAMEPGFWDRPDWISTNVRLTLWCEHCRLPLPALNPPGETRGVYLLSVPRDWLAKASPFLKLLSTTLSLVLPVAASTTELLLDEATTKGLEDQLALGKSSLDSLLKGSEQAGAWLARRDGPGLEWGEAREARMAQGAELRQLQAWLKAKDPGFGGLVRVLDKQRRFRWVHPRFQDQY